MSSGSESDDDYVPEDPEKVSEEESADEETDKQYENEVEKKKQKRKLNENIQGKKKRKTQEIVEEKEENPAEEQLDPEAEKKREDDLWAMFLEGTDTKPKPKEPSKPVANEVKPSSISHTSTKDDKKNDDSKERERRIFEFAGETIVVENNVIKEKIKTGEIPGTAVPKVAPRAGAGISSVLNQLNKKNKLSTLEKSKLDWQTFKKAQGIEEEIQNHNKGKEGYLEKRDFLERADYKQYEIERNLRMTRRSNR